MTEPRCLVCGKPGDGTTCEHDEGPPEAVTELTDTKMWRDLIRERDEARAENRALVEALREIRNGWSGSDPMELVQIARDALASLPPQEPKR